MPIEYGKTGKMSFFVDESGVIRGADNGGGRHCCRQADAVRTIRRLRRLHLRRLGNALDFDTLYLELGTLNFDLVFDLRL